MPETTKGRGELRLRKAWGTALLYPYDDFLKHRILETADSIFWQKKTLQHRIRIHCLSSDGYLLRGTGEDTSIFTMSLANVDGVQQCNKRCQYHMIMSDIMHVLDSHSPAVHTVTCSWYRTQSMQGTQLQEYKVPNARNKGKVQGFCVLLSIISSPLPPVDVYSCAKQ